MMMMWLMRWNYCYHHLSHLFERLQVISCWKSLKIKKHMNKLSQVVVFHILSRTLLMYTAVQLWLCLYISCRTIHIWQDFSLANSYFGIFNFGGWFICYRTLLQNTRDSDSKEWNYHIFLALVNTCSDLSPLHSIDGSFSSLHHYVKLILSVFKRDYSDERDWSLNRILEDDNLFNQGRYSSFMLESLPKSESDLSCN